MQILYVWFQLVHCQMISSAVHYQFASNLASDNERIFKIGLHL